jgi:hypothetical protein
MVRSDEVVVAKPMIRPVPPEPLSPYVLRISSAGPIIPGVFQFSVEARY